MSGKPFERFFVDLEFTETGKNGIGSIELLSIGVQREDGLRYYAVNADADLSRADDWVKENVLPNLGPDHVRKSAAQIAEDLREAFLPDGADSPTPRIYTDYGAYDHVAMCWLWGKMIDLPEGMPMYTRDLRPFFEEHEVSDELMAPSHHNYMHDAMRLRDMWVLLMNKTRITYSDGSTTDPLAWF